jgi:2-phospho-L-lactate guanylyltransferase (CobY/MobA/RfbA family)
MTRVWNTKYGLRRVRHDPPTLEEAIAAASGLTESPHEQAEIAASLMDLPAAEVEAAMAKLRAQRKSLRTIAPTGRAGQQRSVVVERRTSRRPAHKRSFG